MKHASVHSKSPRQDTSLSQHHPIPGPNGVSIAPPAYGIDFVDRQQSTGIGMTVQRQTREDSNAPGGQRENTTGLPDDLKAGIENLAGLSLDDVHVHYNSAKPAQFRALAYTQGTDIHVAPGQEKHLPHEAWHVVQQAQGRVKPTMQMKDGVSVNDDKGLEYEADVMGTKASRICRPDNSRAWAGTRATITVQRTGETGKASQAEGEAIGTSEEKAHVHFPSAVRVRGGGEPTIQRVLEDHGQVTRFLYLVSVDKGEPAPATTDEWKYARLPGQDKNYGGREVYKRDKNIKRVKTPEEIKQEAWDDLEKSLGDYGLYSGLSKGTFEYVAQYLFESMEDKDRRERREQLYEYVHNRWQPKILSDPEKTRHLTEMIALSLTLYDSLDPENQRRGAGAMKPAEIQSAAHEKKVKAPEIVNTTPKAVAVGFHGTSQPMKIVAATKDEKVSTKDMSGTTTQKGWGGLQKPKDISFKQTEYALDASWNPLKKQLAQGAHYRKGKNWDNELLSTVSVATHPTPSIKFPFPSDKSNHAKTYLYAVVVEEAYPTFKIQKEIFPEMAVSQIAPEDIIGVTMVDKYYAPATIKDAVNRYKLSYTPEKDAEQNHETFAYKTYEFTYNDKFKKKWGPRADTVIKTAKKTVEGEIGKAYQWGIYHDMKIAK